MKGQSWPSKKSLGKNINFILFETNQNLEQFGIMITNDTLSFDSAFVFKMMKTLGNKNSPNFHIDVALPKAFYHARQLTEILLTNNQR
jgi:hypothetical protein